MPTSHADFTFPSPFVTDIRVLWAGPAVIKLVFIERCEYVDEGKVTTHTQTRGSFTIPYETFLALRERITMIENQVNEQNEKTIQVIKVPTDGRPN
jgi:hypothetical protein